MILLHEKNILFNCTIPNLFLHSCAKLLPHICGRHCEPTCTPFSKCANVSATISTVILSNESVSHSDLPVCFREQTAFVIEMFVDQVIADNVSYSIVSKLQGVKILNHVRPLIHHRKRPMMVSVDWE